MPRRARPTGPVSPAFDALTVEGGLITPAQLQKIATLQAGDQKEADYGVRKGLRLRDEIARFFRIGQALHEELFVAGAEPSCEAARRFAESLLREVFEFPDVVARPAAVLGDRTYPLGLEAMGGRVPVVVVAPADGLDRASPSLGQDGRRRSAASALQDWLNVHDGAVWGLATDGRSLRLMRDNASLTRPAYIEADLGRIFAAEDFAGFSVLWLLLHATRFGREGAPPHDCLLERWRDAGAKAGVAARDRLRDGFEAALLALGQGLLKHPDNADLRRRLQAGELPLQDFFSQLLRLVYRLIFLLTAEDRGLLHPPTASADARRLYAEGYSLSRLRDRAARRSAYDRHADQWEGLTIVFAALARGEKALGLPALDGLFAQGSLPDIESAKLANRDLMAAIRHLAWLRNGGALVPVNWRDMETEELGSVYEGLLELTPRLTEDGRGFAFAEGAETKGNARKTTGSYYTPDSLVQALLDSALDPVLDRVTAEASDVPQALLSVTVIDPACGSGHFLLAAARRIATRVARARAGGVASAEDYRHALRDVARACIHGVDRNPMAVELTKVALWIETVEPGKPLGFLDANIQCGDALLGIFDLADLAKGIPEAAYKPLTGDDRQTARHFLTRNRAELGGQGSFDFTGGGGRLPQAAPLAAEAKALRAAPEETPDEIAAKRKLFEATRARGWTLQQAADLYVAAFLIPKIGGVPERAGAAMIPTSAHVFEALEKRSVYGPLVGRAQEVAVQARAFHWPLAFPDVMAGGGFDVVLGNPPWERVKLQEQEFFASRDADIAEAPNAAARGRLIAALATAEPGTRERRLHEEFEAAKRTAEASSVFARVPGREGGRFPLTGRGDVNTYALFAELFLRLSSPRGRAGVIVPTGIATDATTAPFFGALVEQRRLASLVDFENRGGIFPSIDSRMKFSLLTIGREVDKARFAFFLQDVSDLDDARRRFSLTPSEIAAINPNTRTAPVFRSKADAALTARIHARVPVLIDEAKGRDGNPWGVSFMAMFHMSNDSAVFRTAAQLAAEGFVRDSVDWVRSQGLRPRQAALDLPGGSSAAELVLAGGREARAPERYVPLYEAKMIHQFDHRWATYDGADSRDVSVDEKADPAFEPTPRYWVPEREVADRLAAKGWTRGWLMGWRDIARATDERTVIATVFPRVGVGNQLPLMLFQIIAEPRALAALVASLVSLTCDYFARHKVGGTHLNFFIYQQLAVLPPSFYSPSDLAFLTPRVLELTYTSHAMAPFARDLGYDGPPFAWDEGRRAMLRAELDAFFAHAYGLTRDELRYVLDPEDAMGKGYPSETFRVLKEKEIRAHGEYRTARLVLAAYDALAKDRRSAA